LIQEFNYLELKNSTDFSTEYSKHHGD